MEKNNIEFERQLEAVCTEYPSLKIKQRAGVKYLQGLIDIKDESNKWINSFLIEIHQTNSFPYGFPILYETGGDIPCSPEWHKYADNSCCITVEPDEIVKCKHGITVVGFIKKYAIPYLANQCYKKETGHYLNEYAHGTEGLIQYYVELMKTSDYAIWIICLKHAFFKMTTLRNSPCFCGSNAKFKNCHLPVIATLKDIGYSNVFKCMNQITNHK